MVQRVSEKISELDAATLPGPEYVLPVANPGVASYKTRLDATGGYVSVTRYQTIQSGGVYDCTVGITAAVAAAAAGGYSLFWPAGTYLTTASVPLLHTVRHRGPGAIKRGSTLFYVEPTQGQSNALYVDSSGVSTNDGLGSSQPMRGFLNAMTVLKNYGPTLEGTWTVNFAAGTYSAPASDYGTTQLGVRSRNPIIFQGASVGGYPNVPTTVVTYTSGTAQGWAFRDYCNVDIRDVKFTAFSTGQATSGTYFCRIKLTNVHSLGNLYDCYCVLGSNAEIVSGILNGNSVSASSYGMIALDESFIQVGVTGGLASLVDISNHGTGVGVFEASSAHCNAVVHDCAYGLRLESSARCNCDTADFQKCTTAAIRVGGNSNAQVDTVVLNTGTANANTRNIIQGGGGVASTVYENTTTARVVECTQNQVTHTGTTTETLLWSFKAFPKEFFPHSFNVSKRALMNVMGRLTGTAGTKRIRVHLHNAASLSGSSDGVAGGRVIGDCIIAAATTTDFWFEMRGSFGLAAQRVAARTFSNGVATLESLQRFSVATSAGDDWYFNLSCELGNAADTLILDHRELEIAG